MYSHDGLTSLLTIHEGVNDAVYNAQPRTTNTNCNLRDVMRDHYFTSGRQSIERAIDNYY